MLLSVLLGLASTACALGSPPLLSDVQARLAAQQQIVPQAFIVQVDASAATLRKRGLSPRAVLDGVLGGFASAGIDYNVSTTFETDPDTFHGLSIKVGGGVLKEDIASISGVHNVWPLRTVKAPKPIPFSAPDGTSSYTSPPLSVAALSASLVTLTGLARRARNPVQVASSDTFGPHVMTGVNITQRASQSGLGIKIASLDTGIDYTNPILGGCFGSGCHISFGYDYVGDNYGTTGVPEPDGDPLDTCNGHGTHTTGVMGALPNSYGFSGVAFKATFGMYRIFSCTGSVTEDIIMTAYMAAMASGANIINLSFNSPEGWTSVTPTEMLIDAAALKGIITTGISGNDRPEGMFFAQEPGTTVNGLSVGSVDVKYLPAYNATIAQGGFATYLTYAGTPLNPPLPSYAIYFTSTDSSNTADACSALPSNTPDLSRSVVIVQRGTCTFVTKFNNILNAGGKVVMLYDQVGSTATPFIDKQGTALDAVATMLRSDGLALLARYVAAGGPGSLTLSYSSSVLVSGVTDPITGGLPSTFTNWGPSSDMFGMPSLVAPGYNVLSTLPVALGGIGISSGTSEAAPFIAGASAVILSARPTENLTPLQIRSLLTTTSTPVYSILNAPSGTLPTSTQLTGAGLVQVNLAVAAKTIITPYQIMLNDSTYFSGATTLSLINRDTVTTKYTFSLTTATTNGVYAKAGDVLPATTPPVLQQTQPATTFFPPRGISVAPGATSSVSLTITPPTFSAATALQFPIYSGFISITAVGSTTQQYNVPFFGMAASCFNMPVFDTTDTLYGSGYNYPLVLNPDTGVTQAADGAVYTKADGPVLFTRLAGASRFVSVDIVLASLSLATTIPTTNNAASPTRFSKRTVMDRARMPREQYGQVATVGNWYTETVEQRDYLLDFGSPAFSDTELQFNGTITTSSGASSTIQIGTSYRFLLRGLKNTGDRNFMDQYESWLSPSWSVSS